MKRVKELGGVCFAQDPDEAEYSDMPRNAIFTALVDQVLPVAEIPARIIAYKESLRSVHIPEEPIRRGASDSQALRDIFVQLRGRTGHDFSNYKHATVLRRIARRMGVHNISDLPSYAQFMREHPPESQALLKDLLISVTHFFRDREAFDTLERKVIPKLFERKGQEDHVRVWVAGCATGEEAYSIAMLLAEHAAAAAREPEHPGVRQRHRRSRGCARARGALYAERCGRRLARTDASVLHQRGRGLSRAQGAARDRSFLRTTTSSGTRRSLISISSPAATC